jgi:hypothetical protein
MFLVHSDSVPFSRELRGFTYIVDADASLALDLDEQNFMNDLD